MRRAGPLASGLLALLAAVPVAPGVATAQTVEEAAAINVQLSIELCLRQGSDVATLRSAFAGAGFTPSTEDFGNGEVLYSYAAPDGHVITTLAPRPGSAECRISTDLYGVSQMIPFSRSVAAQIFRGEIYDQSPEAEVVVPGSAAGANRSCTGFHFFAPQRVIWFKFGVAGQDPVCVDNGTAQIMILL